MNFLHTSYFKKISTSVLLVLFIFIHAVKAFHTHNFSYSHQSGLNKNAATVHTSFSCVICDFQIAKDSDAEVAIIDIAAPFKLITAFYNYTLPQLYNFSATSSVRGAPPVV